MKIRLLFLLFLGLVLAFRLATEPAAVSASVRIDGERLVWRGTFSHAPHEALAFRTGFGSDDFALSGAIARRAEEEQILSVASLASAYSGTLPARSNALELSLHHARGVGRDGIRRGYVSASGESFALPRSLFGAILSGALAVTHEPARSAVERLGLERGLFVNGSEWRLQEGAVSTLHTVEVESAHAREAARAIERALAILTELGVPAPVRAPLVIVLPVLPEAKVTLFGSEAEHEVYVVEAAEHGLLESTLLRDLSSSACERIANARPAEERDLWRGASVLLDQLLAERLGRTFAALRAAASESAYRKEPPQWVLDEALPEDGYVRWLIKHVTAPVHWRGAFQPLGGDPAIQAFLAAALEPKGRSVGYLELAEALHGEAGRARLERFLSKASVGLEAEVEAHDGWPRVDLEAGQEAFQVAGDPLPPIVFTALNAGFLDNCGCSVSQAGGLSRRLAATRRLKEEHDELVLIELGEFVADPYAEAKRSREETLAVGEVLGLAEHDVVVPGWTELCLDADTSKELEALVDAPFVSANVYSRADGKRVWPAFHTLERDVGPIHVIGLTELAFERAPFSAAERTALVRYELRDALAELRSILLSPDRPEGIWILAGSISAETTRAVLHSELAEHVDVLLTSSYRMGEVVGHQSGDVLMRTRGEVGTYRGVFYAHASIERYGMTFLELRSAGSSTHGDARDVRLEPGAEEASDAQALLRQLSLDKAGDPEAWNPSPLAALAAESRPGAGYAGSAACRDCHVAETESWEATPHARAFSTLASKGRELEPDCLRCHTTGFAHLDGFEPGMSPEDHGRLMGVGCETCHGPGSQHVSFHRGTGKTDGIRARPGERTCVRCHDELNAPDFLFAEALPHVLHRSFDAEDAHAGHGH